MAMQTVGGAVTLLLRGENLDSIPLVWQCLRKENSHLPKREQSSQEKVIPKGKPIFKCALLSKKNHIMIK